jgi:hypothetical protein
MSSRSFCESYVGVNAGGEQLLWVVGVAVRVALRVLLRL